MADTDLLEPVASHRSAPPKTRARGPLSKSEIQNQKSEDGPALRSGPLLARTDPELVALGIAGDTDAYGELIARHQYAARQLARRIVRDYQHAEDLAQEAFIKAYQSLADLKDPNRFGPWVGTILRHLALDFLRLSKNTVSLESLREDGFEPEEAGLESVPETAEWQEEDRRVLEVLENLREDYREIIVLKHVERLSYKELASRLGMSVSAVGEKLSRVRALLKRRLEKQAVPRQE
jgi:RNA polymerase sigma-70 factor (ECF subfamily)